MQRYPRYCIAALVLLMTTGCAFIKPTTSLSINPLTRTLTFTDTKDQDIDISGVDLSKNGDDYAFKVESVTISSKASPVIEANVQQMLAFVEQQKAANEGIQIALAGISDIVAKLVPLVEGLSGMVDNLVARLGELTTE